MLIQRHRRFDGFQDHRVPNLITKPKPRRLRNRPWRRHPGALQRLETDELPQCRAAAENPLQPHTAPRIEFQVITLPLEFEPPDLTVSAVLDARPIPRQIPQKIFQRHRRHARLYMRGSPICHLAHQFRHICRYAASMLRANRGASINGDACIRERRVRRNSANRGRSFARPTAIDKYSSVDRAINSGVPILARMLAPPRPTAVWPTRLTTGTPIQSAMQVVIPPPQGNESRAM